MAQNGSNPVPNQQQPEISDKAGKTVKTVTIGGAILLFSPVLIIFSPVWVPLFIIYWVFGYLIGKHPIGADQVDQARDKIVESVEEVMNKVEQLGKDIVTTSGGDGGEGEGN